MRTTLIGGAALCCAALSLSAPAQIRIAPPEPSPAGDSATTGPTEKSEGVAAALAKLRGTDWAPAVDQLIELAREHQQEVLQAVAPLVRDRDDRELSARARSVLRGVIAEHEAAEKRSELRERFRALDDAVGDVAATLGEAPATAAKLEVLRRSLERLRESIDKARPLAPRPLRVPAPGPDVDAKSVPSGGDAEPSEDGYRMIEVDGKQVLVPAKELPEGMEYEAEFKDGGLWIRRFPHGKPKPKGSPDSKKGEPKKGDTKKTGGGTGSRIR